MWEAFLWNSANQMRHLKTLALWGGRRYQELVPEANLVVPHQTHTNKGYEGWAFCARTPAKDLYLAYFEKGCPNPSVIRGGVPYGRYLVHWFNPRNGEWSKAGGIVKADNSGRMMLPAFPSGEDWGLKLLQTWE